MSQLPSINYADLESSIKRIDGCKNNSERLSATKLGEHMSLWVVVIYNMNI